MRIVRQRGHADKLAVEFRKILSVMNAKRLNLMESLGIRAFHRVFAESTMSGDLPRRRWLQFGLRSLILITVACALGLTWWRQWRLSSEIRQLQEQSVRLRDDLEFYRVMCWLDPAIPEQKSALDRASRDRPTNVRRLKIPSANGESEVLLFDLFVTFPGPGTDETLAVLLKDERVIDIVFRRCTRSYEMHDANFEDYNHDGKIDLVFHCQPGFLSGNEPPFDEVYEITGTGFRELKK